MATWWLPGGTITVVNWEMAVEPHGQCRERPQSWGLSMFEWEFMRFVDLMCMSRTCHVSWVDVKGSDTRLVVFFHVLKGFRSWFCSIGDRDAATWCTWMAFVAHFDNVSTRTSWFYCRPDDPQKPTDASWFMMIHIAKLVERPTFSLSQQHRHI